MTACDTGRNQRPVFYAEIPNKSYYLQRVRCTFLSTGLLVRDLVVIYIGWHSRRGRYRSQGL